MKLNKTAVLVCIGLFGSMYSIKAQNNTEIKIYQDLDTIIETAFKNNPNIKVSKLQTEQERALKSASWDIPKTEFGLEYGQTNSIVDNDTRFNASQTFAFPILYSNQNKLSKAKIEASVLNQEVIKNELITQIKSAYYQLWYLKSKQNVLQQQDSIYERFQYAANLRFKTGESNALEQATANAEFADIQIALKDNTSIIRAYQLQLQHLINSESLVDINVGTLEVKTSLFSNGSIDTLGVSKNPLVLFYKAKIEVADKERSVESARMLPDFTLGYINQSFIGNGEAVNGTPTVFDSGDRFTGVQLGLTIPIFFKSHSAKIKAAKIHKLENESQLELVKNYTQSQLLTALASLKKDQQNLEFYRLNAIPQAELLLKNSQRGFQEGEIEYIEYIQGLNRALNIQTKYLAFVNQYNQTLIKIEQLTINN
tara:strand:- start:8256 stop:9533 length:1278 start_codon:yes stop_codon:yes gene_type:complete